MLLYLFDDEQIGTLCSGKWITFLGLSRLLIGLVFVDVISLGV
jgi:hypothetical protein